MGDLPVSGAKYTKASARDIAPERSTCGFRQRLITKDHGAPASVTYLKTHDAARHWHTRTHEYYYVVEGAGALVIDDERVPIEAGDCVWIRPGAKHHAEGELTSLIIAVPAFEPDDIFLDTPDADSPA